MSIEIIQTADGSHSLLNTDLNETYHSHHGAVQESVHVFINNGLNFYFAQRKPQAVKILEVGFGTGLNAFLSILNQSLYSQPIAYTSIEAFPLPQNIWAKLNYASAEQDKHLFQKLHEASWNEWNTICDNFNLLKLKTTLQEATLPQNYFDIIYFDAFAPNKQPEMWALPLLQKIVDSMTNHSVFVTYCAKGQLKRDLKSLGLMVETLAGPPGKKEMVRALKI